MRYAADHSQSIARAAGVPRKTSRLSDGRRFLEEAVRGGGVVLCSRIKAGAFHVEGDEPVQKPTDDGGADEVDREPDREDDDAESDVSRDVPELIARARAGDDEAIRTFVGRFESEVRLIVRDRLPRRLRNQFDSMDFVQAVWQSFFTDLKDGSREFENARHLRGFLAGVARNKVFEQDRRLTRTGKYAVDREKPLYIRRGEREYALDVPAPDPSPSQNVQASDRLALLTAGRPAREVEILTLRHEGRTIDEIAERLGIHEKTVRRIIDAARERMEARGWA
ncbi:RNA polymerase sigma factor [Planctomyces sp. SH-PL62]|nr:RNA polymerase sigma factor [Planctomyces sp. SH-PL62]